MRTLSSLLLLYETQLLAGEVGVQFASSEISGNAESRRAIPRALLMA